MLHWHSRRNPAFWRITEAACKCWWKVFETFVRFVFKLWRAFIASRRWMEVFERCPALRRIEIGQFITDVAFFFSVHYSINLRLWKQFYTSQTVVRRPVACRLRVMTSAEDLYIAVVPKRNRISTSTRVTSTIAATIDKTMSATTVSRSLRMNSRCSQAPRVWVSLSVQSRKSRSYWGCQHVNRTSFDRGTFSSQITPDLPYNTIIRV